MPNQFILPEGYRGWCHQCTDKVTEVPIEQVPQDMAEIGLEVKVKTKTIPGLGFRTIDELSKHIREQHRQYKG